MVHVKRMHGIRRSNKPKPPSSHRFAEIAIASALLTLAVGCAASRAPPASETQTGACAAAAPLAFVCNAERPEDLVRIPGAPWVIASGFARGAGLKLVDSETRTARLWFEGSPDQIEHDAAAYPHCASPPPVSEFTTRGVSFRQHGPHWGVLHVVNHGGRESIEVFRVDWGGEAPPRLQWNGCVPLGELVANSVATFRDGSVIFTVLTLPGRTITDFVHGENTGAVFAWRPSENMPRRLPGTELPGNNGLETGRDETSFFVVAFGSREVIKFNRADSSAPVARAQAPGFMPDNIHWDGDRLLAAGMTYDEPACGGARRIIDGVADTMRCHRGYVVAELDPQTMQFRVIAYGEPNPAFNGASAAIILDDALWLGSYQSDRIATRRLPGAP